MSQFWIDVYSALGVKQNEHTQAVSNVRITDRISQIGECEFSMPAAVATQIGATYGKKYRLYHETLGDLGTYTHYDSTTDAETRQVTIKCYDLMVILANRIFAFSEGFTNETIADIATAVLLAAPTPWTVSFESGFDLAQTATLEFFGESFLRALDVLRQYTRGYFRREADYAMHFGSFTATTPVFRLYSPTLASADAGGDYATITALRRERRGTGVVNRVVPFGAGVGETVVDLSFSTRTEPYGIEASVFEGSGGDLNYYIEDIPSGVAYGIVERVLSFTEVRPLTNSAADLENAANAVYDLSVAYLQKSKDPIDAYSLSCINLPMTVKVGDLIRVDYQGVATLEDETVAWLSLDNQKFFITEITRDFGESGEPTAQLTVSTNGEEIVGTTEVFSSLMGDVSGLKLRVQPSMTMFNKASPTLPIDPTRDVEMKFYIGSEMLAINEMKVEFTLMPLRSFTNVTGASTLNTTEVAPTTTVASDGGGGVTIASSGGGGTTTTSAAPGFGHSHAVPVTNGALGTPLYFNNGSGTLQSAHGGVGFTEFITLNEQSHTHSVTIPDHTHSVPLPTHTHSVPLPSHSHSMQHLHSLSFGITDDSITPSGVSVQINGDGVGDIIDTSTGANVGGTASGAGLFIVDILPTLLAQGDFRNKTHTVLFQCAGNQGQLFAQLLSRVTIQPIGVV